MISYSYNSNLGGTLNANNWLVSPAITLHAQGSHTLSFFIRCANSSYPDTIKVMLTTGAGTNTSDFTTTLIPFTSISSQSYEQFTADLSAYNGQTIKLAFVHQSYDGWYLRLDDISIVDISATYTINAQSSDTTMGTVTGGGTYSAGETVTLMANAN